MVDDPTIYRYTFRATVLRVERRDEITSTRPNAADPDNPIVDRRDLGWFILLSGSHELIHIGMEEPAIEPGQRARVTIEVSA
jgi:hypothetical protein